MPGWVAHKGYVCYALIRRTYPEELSLPCPLHQFGQPRFPVLFLCTGKLSYSARLHDKHSPFVYQRSLFPKSDASA